MKEVSDTLGIRMKAYEQEYRLPVPDNQWVILRLDGRGFSKFTKKMGFSKPFDGVMTEMMNRTAVRLAKEFQAVVAYVQSDEITLLIPPYYTGFSRRSEKLVGCSASMAGAVFFQAAWEILGKQGNETLFEELSSINGNLLKEINTCAAEPIKKFPVQQRDKMWDTFQKSLPTFDCRLFAVDSYQEAANAVLWRYNDAIKNSIIGLAQVFFTQKQLDKVNQEHQLDLLNSIGVQWRSLPPTQQHGNVYILQETEKPKPSQYVKDGESPTVTRRVWECVDTHPNSYFFLEYLSENAISYNHRQGK